MKIPSDGREKSLPVEAGLMPTIRAERQAPTRQNGLKQQLAYGFRSLLPQTLKFGSNSIYEIIGLYLEI
jgi:hypothetical protein